MFNIFKTDPIKKLKKDFENKLTEAVEAQRNGKIELYAKLTTESEEILKELELLEKDIKR
jgi:molybdenum-dependent DNA-binding transcriptional regulator ModE